MRCFIAVVFCLFSLAANALDRPALPDGAKPYPAGLVELIRQKAPPVAVPCFLAWTENIPVSEIYENAARYEKVEPDDEEGLAKFFIGYVYAGCFDKNDIDALSKDEDNYFHSPSSLIFALENLGLFKRYDAEELTGLIEAFNAHQDCLYGLAKDCIPDTLHGIRLLKKPPITDPYAVHTSESIPVPRGHSQIAISDDDDPRHFALRVTLTKKSHTEDVDGGVDIYRTVFMRKSDMQVAGEHDALYVVSSAQMSVLAEGAEESCLGTNYGERLIVLGNDKSQPILTVALPEGVSEIEGEPSIRADGHRFRIRGQQLMTDPRAESCDLPYWARHYDYRYTIRCAGGGRRCNVEKQLIRAYQGCANIGGCD